MKKKWIIIVILILAAGGIGGYFLLKPGTVKKVYTYAEVTRGDLAESISCTGSLNFKNTSAVNFQTSGTVQAVYADYNQNVKKGQVLATLDRTLLNLAVQSAEAQILVAQNQLTQARKNYDDTRSLFDDNFKSQSDLDNAKMSLDSATANLVTCKITLSQAQANFSYGVIYSPISGIVIQKNISAGQTIAGTSAQSSGTNFVIAGDTARMQITATVDESEITKIKAGQKANFTVTSYSDKTFTGKVSQVRMQPATSDNVVVYTIVIDANNPKNLLLPGMTATVDIVTKSRTGVLKVPVAALKFQPAAAQIQAMMKDRQPPEENNNASTNRKPSAPPAAAAADRGTLWAYDETAKKLTMIPVIIGMSDGAYTEITLDQFAPDAALEEGEKIITGTTTASKTAAKSTAGKGGILNAVSGGGQGGPGGGMPPMPGR